jgi:23S rRNA (cytidine2498-2'-O)-methyltransferase
MLFRCQPGFENWLADELPAGSVAERGEGWVRTSGLTEDFGLLGSLCFAHATLLDDIEITGDSVNALADKVVAYFFETARQERFEGSWEFSVETAGGLDGLGRRADAVGRTVSDLLKKKMSRVAKLATNDRLVTRGEARGLFLYFPDFRRAIVSRRTYFGGQRRMADDSLAPSRSYLKIEEAYGVLGRAPVEGETVVDLGAAPGGWSYSAAKRGARVIAVDNGPLKGGALDNPMIEHRREDAFHFLPAEGEVFDWMYCDLVEDPHHVMQNLVAPWIERGWCRRFVVNLKFGRVDPIALLHELRAREGVLATRAREVRIRHLFHDREEFTIVGEVIPS